MIDKNHPYYRHFGQEFKALMDTLPTANELVPRDAYIDLLKEKMKGNLEGFGGYRNFRKFLDYMEMLVSNCK